MCLYTVKGKYTKKFIHPKEQKNDNGEWLGIVADS